MAQVVDGNWALVPGGVRTTQVDYDRVLAFGDLLWDDYEVTVPISVHAVDPDGYIFPSVNPGFGLTMRWTGHTDSPVVCAQPHCGWLPSGAGAWYDIGQDGPLLLDGLSDSSVTIEEGDTYYWKMRVETIPGNWIFVLAEGMGSRAGRAGDVEPDQPKGVGRCHKRVFALRCPPCGCDIGGCDYYATRSKPLYNEG